MSARPSIHSGCLQIHILGLVFTIILMAAFVVFMLIPFTRQVSGAFEQGLHMFSKAGVVPGRVGSCVAESATGG